MSDLAGRTFVVTGANTGIGRATAEAFAERGGRVIFAGRSAERTEPVIAALRARIPSADAHFLQLDLASLAQTAEAARELLERESRLDVLVANAGLAGHQGVTEDGFEIQFGVNHVGHYLFTRLLLERLKESAPARIVIVASRNHLKARGIDWDAVRRPTATTVGLHEYDVSKLANVLFARELAKRLEGTGVTTYALNPGRVASDVWRRIPGPVRWLMKRTMLTNEEGARTSIHCATAPELAHESGRYYQDCAIAKHNPLVDDEALARELWDRSEAWVRDYL
jgi:NAD(P)-dependent dehydrogenase (short-subunit alcohol dehydrogenase family)